MVKMNNDKTDNLKNWWARLDSNQGLSRYKLDTLTN